MFSLEFLDILLSTTKLGLTGCLPNLELTWHTTVYRGSRSGIVLHLAQARCIHASRNDVMADIVGVEKGGLVLVLALYQGLTRLRIAPFDRGVYDAEKLFHTEQFALLAGNLSLDIADVAEGRLGFAVVSDNVEHELVILSSQGLEAVLSTLDVDLALFECFLDQGGGFALEAGAMGVDASVCARADAQRMGG